MSAGRGLRLDLDQVELRPGAVRTRPAIEDRVLGGVLFVGPRRAHVDATALLTFLGDSHLRFLRLRIGPVDGSGRAGTFASSAEVGRPCGRLTGPLSTIASVSTPIPTKDPRIVALPAAEIRRRFVEFFAERGHTVVPSASLVPAGDATLLFTNSGMVQFKEVFTGAEKRSYTRAVDYQRVLRVAGKHNDFEEVGRTPRHHTLFEMLGNWSFGDYFKREAIHWAWDFLTRDLGIPGERLAATTYTTDDFAHEVWRDEIQLPPERLVRWGDFPNGDEKNWWRMADVGPCGPCSEIHFDRGGHLSEGPECIPDHSETCPRWLEIWNLVFMQFDRSADGTLTPLPFPSVDTGMGLERMTSAVQGVDSNYLTDLFTPIIDRLAQHLGHDPQAVE